LCASSWKQTLAPNVKWPSFLCAESTPNPSGCPLERPTLLGTVSASPRSPGSPRTTRPRDSFRISTTLRRNISEPDLESQRTEGCPCGSSTLKRIPGTVQMYRPGPLPLNALRRNISETDLRVAPTGAPTNTLDRRPCNPTRLLQDVDYIHQS
jgi:hypothetical protein